jgi:hypothetical protein
VKVATVLRLGGEYGPEHVYAIRRMLNRHLPGHEFICLSDCVALNGTQRPLKHDWPGWWAKMELCRPEIEGPLLFLDLDTVVVGDLSPLVADTSRSIVLRDFYRGKRKRNAVQSALMLLTEEDRAAVWERWSRDPEGWMRRKRSDQDVYEAVLKDRALFWQDTHPGAVVGYKTDLARGRKPVPEGARVVCFHGRPRPWDCGKAWAEGAFR